MRVESVGSSGPPRWLALLALLGVYLTLRGYHSRDGDQAYRLPLLRHAQDPTLFASDPFVRAFDGFNPHRGYLALLDVASRPAGLSAALFGLFVVTFGLTYLGIDRLARAVWPGGGSWVGVVAAGLVFTAKAGNIGTNHLFEAMLLDRLLALALGWNALASFVSAPRQAVGLAPVLLAVAAWVHPSMGLQLTLVLAGGWGLGVLAGRWTGLRPVPTVLALALLGLAMAPTLGALPGQRATLFAGMAPEAFVQVAAYVQSPQHMIPHLWRLPQWLAWVAYLVLASVSLAADRSRPVAVESGSARLTPERARFLVLMLTTLAGLAVAWLAIERLHDPGVTLFQPFRLATVVRGLALVAVSGHILRMSQEPTRTGPIRALLLTVGLTGDWAWVMAILTEVSFTLASRFGHRTATLAGSLALAGGLFYLAHHDTESGQVRLLLALGTGLLVAAVQSRGAIVWTPSRLLRWTALAWAVPLAALMLPPLLAERRPEWLGPLITHARFGAWPIDPLETLAVWCREHTPASARFIGPPGPKTFRLWSERSLAFNRAGSPYHAAGIADWIARFRDHVGFEGSQAEFVAAYLSRRQELERGYDRKSPAQLAELARRQGADNVLARRVNGINQTSPGPLRLLHAQGPWAVYQVVAEPEHADDRSIAGNRPGDDPVVEAAHTQEASSTGP